MAVSHKIIKLVGRIAAAAWVAQRAGVHTRIEILPIWVERPMIVAVITIFAPAMFNAVPAWIGPDRFLWSHDV